MLQSGYLPVEEGQQADKQVFRIEDEMAEQMTRVTYMMSGVPCDIARVYLGLQGGRRSYLALVNQSRSSIEREGPPATSAPGRFPEIRGRAGRPEAF
jgi:hypothetical protein